MHLHYVAQGQGPPLIILHGFLGSSDNWRMMSKRFAAHYRVFCVDLRNHGRSPHSEVMNYRVMAQDLGEFFDSKGLSSALLLGHSMGGKVAMQFAGDSPARLDKLVVVDIAPKSYPPSQRELLTALQNLDLRAVKSFADADAALAHVVTESGLRQFLIKNLDRTSSGEFRWRIALDVMAANYDESLKAVTIEIPFDKPACFLRAGRSDFIEDTDIASIRESFPRAEIQTIARAGHWLHVDAPDEFYRIVAHFLG
jgi:esterase